MVIMLPTVKGPIIKGFDSDKIKLLDTTELFGHQHLYLTSSDKINEGDWFIGDNISLQQCTLNNAGNINFKGGWYSGSSNTKKVIATTDTLLILGKFNTSPGKIGYPKSYVPKLTQQFVEEYIELYNNKVPTKELKDSWNKEEIIALFTKYGEDKRVCIKWFLENNL